ncbi:MAG: hypothetical protein AB7U73_01150 [Pirellulales bacterium]
MTTDATATTNGTLAEGVLERLKARQEAPARQDRVVTVRMPAELHQNLRDVAHKLRTSMNGLCVLALATAAEQLGRRLTMPLDESYKAIPVHVAKQIADHFDKSIVVILAYDQAFLHTHTTTYGRDATDKIAAAQWGEVCTNAVGADIRERTDFEDFRKHFDAGCLKEAVELLEWLKDNLPAGHTGAIGEFLQRRADRLRSA